MTTEKRKITTIIFSIFIVIAIVIVLPLFAAQNAIFSSDLPVGGDVVIENVINFPSSEINYKDNIEYKEMPLIYKKAGDSFKAELKTTNATDRPFHYYFGIVLNNPSSPLSSAVLVYFDDVFLGTLSFLASTSEFKIDRDFYISPNSTGDNARNHTISFELHNSAQDSILDGTSCSVKIISYASTPNYQNTLFVSSDADFKAAVDDINFGLQNPSIVLLDNTLLTNNYVIENPFTLDLNGFILNLNEKTITLSHSGIVKIKSSAKARYNELPSFLGSIDLDTPLGVLDIEDFYYTAQDLNLYNVGKTYASLVNLYSYSVDAAENLLYNRLKSNLQHGILAGNSKQVLGALDLYLTQTGEVNKLPLNTGLNFSYQAGSITADNSANNTYIKIGNKILNFKIYQNGAILDVLEDLSFIPNSVPPLIANVSYDLYLPVTLKQHNAVITWITSNEAFMSHSGKIGKDLEGETTVTLTAIIKISGSEFTKSYTFRVFERNNEIKFSEFVSRLNPITLSEVFDAAGSVVNLPVVDFNSNYHYTKTWEDRKEAGEPAYFKWNTEESDKVNDIGLDSLSYSVQSIYSYVTVRNSGTNRQLFLNTPVFYTYAQLTVYGTFTNDIETVHEGSVNIQIKLGDSTKMQEVVFSHVSEILAQTDVLENIITTRKLYGMANERGDFNLPTSYETCYISYSSEYDTTGISRVTGNLILPDADPTKYSNYSSYKVAINPEKLLINEININIKVTIYLAGATSELGTVRNLSFKVPAAIHNDTQGFSDPATFESIKFQVYQQLPQEERTKPTGNVSGYNSGYTIIADQVEKSFDEGFYNYILLRDIGLETTNKLVFSRENTADEFLRLLGWASAKNVRSQAQNVVTSLSLSSLTNTSNGSPVISAMEKATIKDYYLSYDPTLSSAQFEAQWSKATYKSSEYAVFTDLGGFTRQVNAYYRANTSHFDSTEFLNKFNEVIAWATSTKVGSTENDTPNLFYMPNSYQSYRNDGKISISVAEHGYISYWLSFQTFTANKHGGNKTIIRNATTSANILNAFNQAIQIEPVYFTDNGKTDLYNSLKGNFRASLNTTTLPNSSFRYSTLTSMDAILTGFNYFTNLKELYVIGSEDIFAPIFSSNTTLNSFFYSVTSSKNKLEKFTFSSCAIEDIAELDISTLTKLKETLYYVDLSGNTGLKSISALTEMVYKDNLEVKANISYINVENIGTSKNYFDTTIAYYYYKFLSSNGYAPEIFYSDTGDGVLNQDKTPISELALEYSILLDYLYYVEDFFEFRAEYMQLLESIYANNTNLTINWQVETGNPIIEIGTDAISSKSTAQELESLLITYTISGTYQTKESIQNNTNTRNKYYYVTSDSSVYQMLSSGPNFIKKMEVGPHIYLGNTVSSNKSPTGSFKKNYIYTLVYTTNTRVFSFAESEFSLNNFMSDRTSVDYGKYYYYSGETITHYSVYYDKDNVQKSSFTFTKNAVYKLLKNSAGNFYLTTTHDLASSCEKVADQENFMTILGNEANVGKLYQYTSTYVGNMYVTGAIYQLYKNENGVVDFRRVGSTSLTSQNGLRVNNHRNFTETTGYRGTGGNDKITISVTISNATTSITRKFLVNIIGSDSR